ncbi:MAG: tRNA (adenosine(37)-N6)-threonylcarbamoyltransferase complex ATPase subunit type 1 TsaE [Treponema sp.]
MNLKTINASETMQVGKEIGSLLQKGDILALQGTLAAGKTQLTKGIACGLSIEEPITSPTFTLISEYSGRLPLYHMDVYRLNSCEDFLDTGAEDLLYGEGVCVIEWSEKIMSELPPATIIIHITINTDGSRTITFDNWQYSTAPFTKWEADV